MYARTHTRPLDLYNYINVRQLNLEQHCDNFPATIHHARLRGPTSSKGVQSCMQYCLYFLYNSWDYDIGVQLFIKQTGLIFKHVSQFLKL